MGSVLCYMYYSVDVSYSFVCTWVCVYVGLCVRVCVCVCAQCLYPLYPLLPDDLLDCTVRGFLLYCLREFYFNLIVPCA